MRAFFVALSLSFILASCSSSYLTVQTNFLSQRNLASTYLGTPDPRQYYPAVGESLIISWSVPKKLLCLSDLRLEVTIRFRNREEIREVYGIEKMRGTYIFSLLNNDYLIAGGILTYKIDLIGGGVIFEEWRHQIWAELIEICPENKSHENLASEKNGIEDYPIDWEE